MPISQIKMTLNPKPVISIDSELMTDASVQWPGKQFGTDVMMRGVMAETGLGRRLLNTTAIQVQSTEPSHAGRPSVKLKPYSRVREALPVSGPAD